MKKLQDITSTDFARSMVDDHQADADRYYLITKDFMQKSLRERLSSLVDELERDQNNSLAYIANNSRDGNYWNCVEAEIGNRVRNYIKKGLEKILSAPEGVEEKEEPQDPTMSDLELLEERVARLEKLHSTSFLDRD